MSQDKTEEKLRKAQEKVIEELKEFFEGGDRSIDELIDKSRSLLLGLDEENLGPKVATLQVGLKFNDDTFRLRVVRNGVPMVDGNVELDFPFDFGGLEGLKADGHAKLDKRAMAICENELLEPGATLETIAKNTVKRWEAEVQRERDHKELQQRFALLLVRELSISHIPVIWPNEDYLYAGGKGAGGDDGIYVDFRLAVGRIEAGEQMETVLREVLNDTDHRWAEYEGKNRRATWDEGVRAYLRGESPVAMLTQAIQARAGYAPVNEKDILVLQKALRAIQGKPSKSKR